VYLTIKLYKQPVLIPILISIKTISVGPTRTGGIWSPWQCFCLSDSAYALYDRDFLTNLGSVLLYAVVGTLFNVFAIGGLLYLIWYIGAMGSLGYDHEDKEMELDLLSCLVFSSLISAVDPVAVLAIFEEIGVNMGLYFLVFGESLLNDGVTVVLYNTMIALSGQEVIEPQQFVLAFFSFFTVVLGGLAIGIIFGILSAFILKMTKDVRVIEPLIILTMAYFGFILAECIHWSGIISLIGCGIVQKRYAFPNISQKSYTTVKYGIKTLASFCDCIIFLFLGIVVFSEELQWNTGFVLWTVFLCLIIRY
jgi:sodium/hydrogen exchanger 3